jgi:hypothetical protein
VIPPEASAAFVAAMEDVLDVYQRPHDPQRPLVCFDETSKQMIKERRGRRWRRSKRSTGSPRWCAPPLVIGTVALTDGSTVKGFLCEGHALRAALDITSFRGWCAWLAASA